MAQYKKWLVNESKREDMKIKVRFIKDDYTGHSNHHLTWFIKISSYIGTIKIPEVLFTSKNPKFTENERKAIGLHELGHLKMWKNFGFRGVLSHQKENQEWIESEADAYVKRRGLGKSLASYLRKTRKLKKKLSRESLKLRIKIWWRKHTWSHRYPDLNKRIEKLVDC